MNLIQKYKEQSIDRLNVNCGIIENLKNHEIRTMDNLCQKSKTDLKEIGLQTNDVNKIYVELQLLGLNLKGSL